MCVSRVEIFNNVINEKCTRFTDSFTFRDNRGKTDAVFKWCSILSCLLLSFTVVFFHIFSSLPYTSTGHCKKGQSQISNGNQLSTINIR